jgi:hypothetical protein
VTALLEQLFAALTAHDAEDMLGVQAGARADRVGREGLQPPAVACEQIKRDELLSEEWLPNGDELTATKELKREGGPQ